MFSIGINKIKSGGCIVFQLGWGGEFGRGLIISLLKDRIFLIIYLWCELVEEECS